MSLLFCLALGLTARAGEFVEADRSFETGDAYRKISVEKGGLIFAPGPEEAWQAPFDVVSTGPGEMLLLSIEDSGGVGRFPALSLFSATHIGVVRCTWNKAPASWEVLAGYDVVAVLGEGAGPPVELAALRRFIDCGGLAIVSLSAAKNLFSGSDVDRGSFEPLVQDEQGPWVWQGGPAGNLMLIDSRRLGSVGREDGLEDLTASLEKFLATSGRPLAAPPGRLFPSLVSAASMLLDQRKQAPDFAFLLVVLGVVMAGGVLLRLHWRYRRIVEWAAGALLLAGLVWIVAGLELPADLVRAGVYYLKTDGTVAGGLEYVVGADGKGLSVEAPGPVRPVGTSFSGMMVSSYELKSRPGRTRLDIERVPQPPAALVVRNDLVGQKVQYSRMKAVGRNSQFTSLAGLLWQTAPPMPVGVVVKGVPYDSGVNIRVGGRRPSGVFSVSVLLFEKAPEELRAPVFAE